MDGLPRIQLIFLKVFFKKYDGCADYALKIVEMTLKETFER